MGFSVLYVCTGNICRSPLGERLFRAGLPPSSGVTVTSAGTHGLTGWGIDAPSALALRELGVDPEGHSARLLDERIAAGADLVLTATAEHRRAVQQWAPAERVFTMREFARLAQANPVATSTDRAGLVARVAQLAQARSAGGSRGSENIADPYGAGLTEARAIAAQISSTVDTALAGLALA